MDSQLFSKLPFLFVSFLFLFSNASSLRSPAPSPSPTRQNPSEFILTSCNATLYPDTCITSLSRYANYVRHDPAQLARIAIGLSLVRARTVLASISNMTVEANYVPDQRAVSAVHDCKSLLGDTVSQMRESLKQMSQLGSGTELVRFQISNVQTWMSAALTNEDTCSDGFQEVINCQVKTEVCDKVGNVKEFTSNALALVNNFATFVGQ